MKFKLTTLLIFATIASFAQFGEHEKLDYSFEIGKVNYMVFEKLMPSNSAIDTTFFTFYRIGSDKLLATEIKKVVNKKTGEILKSGYYNIGEKSITFFLIGEKAPHLQRLYTQNSKGLLALKTSYVNIVEKEEEKPKYEAEPVSNIDIVETVGVKDAYYSPPPVEPKIDVNAQYPGGLNAVYAFLGKNIRYPIDALQNKISGKVVVSFIIDVDGSITNIKTTQKLGFGCDEEVVRVMKLMPKWMPAQSKGKPISSNLSLPITFMQ